MADNVLEPYTFSFGDAKPASTGCSSRVWVFPTSILQRKWCLHRQTHCLQMLWNLSTCFPNLKIILQIRPSVFKFNLKRAVIFLLRRFLRLHPQQTGRVGTNLQFLNPILQIQLQNTCWASPKPDVQHKNALVSHLNGRWISIFFEKNSFQKNQRWFIQYHIKPDLLLPVFPWDPPKIHWKPEGMLPKYFCFIVICFLQAFIEPWKSNDRLHGIPGHDPDNESRKTPLKGGRKAMQRERHPKSEITLIRKTGTSSSDFALKLTSHFLKTGTTSS